MKKIVFALLIMFSIPALAQRIDKPGEPYDAFCKVYYPLQETPYITIPNGFGGSLYDKDGNYIKFADMSDFFTYMSKLGWTFVKDVEQNIYLFKKQVTSDEQIKEGLFFKEDFKKKKGGD
jgi:hypothetical protein